MGYVILLWHSLSLPYTYLGKLKNYEHHIEIDKSMPSVVHPPRRVPFALHDKVKKGASMYGINERHRESVRANRMD